MTKVYGASDDLIEFDGDILGEVSCYGTDDRERGVLLSFSDGTLIEAKYGKGSLGIWGLYILKRGSLLDEVKPCENEDANPHSDVASFHPGLKFCLASTEWEFVK